MSSGWIMAGSTVTEAPPSDSDLVRRMASGDESAVAALYDRYGNVMYAVAYRIMGQKADAEEVVMEAFTQVWRDAARFEAARGSVAAWLTMISRSRALDQIRSRDRRERLNTAAAREDQVQTTPTGNRGSDPGYQVEQTERQKRVAAALESLSPTQRQAIELAYYEGLSQSEIAERLNEPLGTIKTRVRLGMMKLREALRPYYYEPAV
jgi:RNA polymerase sigma-70 factor (ECF subfamily)